MASLPGVDHLCLRPAEPSDAPFLLELYRSIQHPEFASLPPAQQELLLAIQFRARQESYARAYPNSVDHVILLDSAPIGRLWTADLPQEHRIIDLALLPCYRSAGIGTRLLTTEIQRAAKGSKPLRLSVHQTNHHARRLYHRLGFTPVESGPIHLTLETAG